MPLGRSVPFRAVPCRSTLYFGQESEAGELVVSNTCRVTASQLREFLRRSLDKYKRALVEPGEVSCRSRGSLRRLIRKKT